MTLQQKIEEVVYSTSLKPVYSVKEAEEDNDRIINTLLTLIKEHIKGIVPEEKVACENDCSHWHGCDKDFNDCRAEIIKRLEEN